MKKNTMMRLASILLVAVLISTSAISGTYAKYVTQGSGEDSARVAKWGVDINVVNGSSFAQSYTSDNGVTVQATEKVVAPGTSSDEVDGNVTFAISGTPEVAVKIDVKFEKTNEIMLAAGKYLDGTTANDKNDEFTLSTDYYPVVFTLTDSEGNVVAEGTLADIERGFNEKSSDYIAPNTDLAETYTLTWVWEFGEEDGISETDKADTYLGNQNPLQTMGYTLTITVTQVD